MKEGPTRQARIRERSAHRRAQRKDDLRRIILDAAVDLFSREGYEGFSLRQVAEEIGYSATTIYLHFTDKDDLLHHVALEGFRSFGEDLEAAAHVPGGTFAKLAAIGRAYVKFGMTRPVHYRLMFMARPELLRRPVPAGYPCVHDSFGVLRRTVEEGLASGELRPHSVDVYASFLWAAVHGLVSLHLATDDIPAEHLEVLLEQHMEVIRRGLQP